MLDRTALEAISRNDETIKIDIAVKQLMIRERDEMLSIKAQPLVITHRELFIKINWDLHGGLVFFMMPIKNITQRFTVVQIYHALLLGTTADDCEVIKE